MTRKLRSMIGKIRAVVSGVIALALIWVVTRDHRQ